MATARPTAFSGSIAILFAIAAAAYSFLPSDAEASPERKPGPGAEEEQALHPLSSDPLDDERRESRAKSMWGEAQSVCPESDELWVLTGM